MQPTDIGAHISTRFGGTADVTAAGTGDATEVDSPWIDRQDYFSCKVSVGYEAVLADTEDIAIGLNLQDATSAAGAGAADFGTAVPSAVLVTSSGGTTETGVLEADFNLMTARQFIRLQYTPDMSAAATDTAELGAIVILGGPEDKPAV
jgi:hypothetical protein